MTAVSGLPAAHCRISAQTSVDGENHAHQYHHLSQTNEEGEWVKEQQGPHKLSRSQLSHALVRRRSHGSVENVRAGVVDDERFLTKPRAFTATSTPVSPFDDIIGATQSANKFQEAPASFEADTLSDGRRLVGTSASAMAVCRADSALVKRDRCPMIATIHVLSTHVRFSSADGRPEEGNPSLMHKRDGEVPPAARARKRSLLVAHARATRIDSDSHDEAGTINALPLSRDASSNYSLEEENEDTWM